MTALGDLCSCGDIAMPGDDLCAGCHSDFVALRAEVQREAAELTAAHEARVQAQDTVAA